MKIKIANNKEVQRLKSKNHPKISAILNELGLVFSQEIKVCITDDRNFKVEFFDDNFPNCEIVEFRPYIPKNVNWSSEEFEEYKLIFRDRESYENKMFNAGGANAGHMLRQ